MASVTNVDADVRDLGRRIICHLRLPFLPARRTVDSPKVPFMRAEHANQGLFPTVTFAPQYAYNRLAPAKRARRRGSFHNRGFTVACKIFGIRLKKNPR